MLLRRSSKDRIIIQQYIIIEIMSYLVVLGPKTVSERKSRSQTRKLSVSKKRKEPTDKEKPAKKQRAKRRGSVRSPVVNLTGKSSHNVIKCNCNHAIIAISANS